MEAARQLSIPIRGLDLHNGDQVLGVVKNGTLAATVVPFKAPKTEPRDKAAEIEAFLADFTGKFVNPEVDLSDDPRAQAILNR